MSKHKVTKEQAQEIIDKFMSGVGRTQLATEYHIGTTTVWSILHGIAWKECNRPNNIQEVIDTQVSLRSGSKCKELPPFTNIQKDVLIGSLLGDGSLHKTNANSYFSKLQMHTKKSYVDWHFKIFSEYSRKVYAIFSINKLITNDDGTIGRVNVSKYLSAYSFYTFRHQNFTELRNKWYPEGVKKIPSDLNLNSRSIAIWFFDDGTNSIKHNRSASIATNSFTLEEVEFLKYKLKEFDLFPVIKIHTSKCSHKESPVLSFYGRSYDNLISIVKPYMLWDCFAYKVEWYPAKKQWESSGKLSEVQVKEIIKIGKTKSQKETAKKFNISHSAINKIVNHKSWKHLI